MVNSNQECQKYIFGSVDRVMLLCIDPADTELGVDHRLAFVVRKTGRGGTLPFSSPAFPLTR